MGSFTESIKANCKEVLEIANRNMYHIFVQVVEGIVKYGPSSYTRGNYADGLFTNQWYPQTGGGFSSMLGTSLSREGDGTLARLDAMKGSREFYGKDGVFTLTNNVHYGFRIEYEGWPKDTPGHNWKGATPYRMISTTLLNVKNSIQQ